MNYVRWSNRCFRCCHRVVSHLLIVSTLGLAACSDLGDTAQFPSVGEGRAAYTGVHRTAPGTGAALALQPCVGGYYADRISGDYAGYDRLQQFVENMVRRHGFEREYLQGLFSQAKRKEWTLNYFAKSDTSLKKPPSKGSWTRYRAKFLDERRIGVGAEFARRHRAALVRATRMYGVPEEYIIGILAIETNFGQNLGSHRVLDALTTLGFDYGRRGPFFRDELEQFLLMARSEGMDPAKTQGILCRCHGAWTVHAQQFSSVGC